MALRDAALLLGMCQACSNPLVIRHCSGMAGHIGEYVTYHPGS